MTTLLFLGAGASRPFDIPTMQEMVDQFENELRQKNISELSLYSNIKKIQESNYIFKADIESIFSVIQGIASNVKPRGLGHLAYYYIASNNVNKEFSANEIEQAKTLRSLLEDFVKRKCEPSKSPTEMSKIYSNSYHALFSTLKGTQPKSFGAGIVYQMDWRAFTTNYDLIFEQFWGDFLIPKDYFVRDGDSANHVFTTDVAYPNPHAFIKLHGSLDWFHEQSGKIMKINQAYTRHLVQGKVMIFPIQQKDMYLHPWITLFQDLKRSLKEMNEWIVIGYAFNDEFIFEIFKEALLAESKKLVIISPHATDLRNKFPQELRTKIVALPIKFGDAYFPFQIKDFFEDIRTLEVRIKTKSQIFGFRSSLPIRFFEAVGDNGPNRTSEKGVNQVMLAGEVVHKDDHVVKCTLKVSHESPYDKNLELQFVSTDSYDTDIAVYVQDRPVGNLQSKTNQEKTGGQYYSDSIKIPSNALFVKT